MRTYSPDNVVTTIFPGKICGTGGYQCRDENVLCDENDGALVDIDKLILDTHHSLRCAA